MTLLKKNLDDMSPAEPDDASFDLPKFWSLRWSRNYGLCFLTQKPIFQYIFDQKHFMNRDKPIHDLKNQ
jgi:hypothetical protein